MGNPLPRSQSLTSRQKWNSGQQKWDSASGNSRPTKASGTPSCGLQAASDRVGSSGELTNVGRPKIFYSGEFPRSMGPGRHPSPTPLYVTGSSAANAQGIAVTRDAATNTDDGSNLAGKDSASAISEAFRSGRLRSSVRVRKEEQLLSSKDALRQDVPRPESSSREAKCGLDALQMSSGGSAMTGLVDPVTTSVQMEKEGSHSRLLSRGGESSSFRGRQSSSSFRKESSSFRRETVSSSFRKEVSGPRRRERKGTKSFQDGDMSSIASESARGSPCSIHYNEAPFSKNCQTPQGGVPWTSSPSSPDTAFGKSAVPFQWEEAPGKAKTIAAAAEMALARKLVRDESLRKLNGASPRSSVDSRGSFRIEKKSSPVVSRRFASEQQAQQQLSSAATLPVPLSRKGSQESTIPRKDSHSSQLIEDLKAAVVRKQAEEWSSKMGSQSFKTEVDEDSRSVISDYCAGDTHIDLVAPAAAKFLNREDDVPNVTPVKTPLASVPFKWEEAPGKPKETGSSPARAEPPPLALPPRLLNGCHNPSKEQQAKIFQTYSSNLMDMQWSSSGNPSPVSRSRDSTPSRRERTPTRRDRTPTKRDLTPGRRELTPTRRDSTPTRNFFPGRALRSGPISFAAVAAVENVRENRSGPLRSNTYPNYLNVPPRNVSQEFAKITQESALAVLTQDLDRSNRTSTSDPGSAQLGNYVSSRKVSQELQLVRYDTPSASDATSSRGTETSVEQSVGESSQECRALVKVAPLLSAVDPLSPTSILCGPDLSSQRTASNLSSAYAESSHSFHHDVISGAHTKTESLTSLESFVDEAYNFPTWSGSETVDSPYRDLGPIDFEPTEITHGSKSVEQGVKAIVRFCRKARKWNKSKVAQRNSSAEPDMWAPTLSTCFQKIELGSNILNKVGSQVYPEAKESRTVNMNYAGLLSVPCSPLKYIPRSGELTMTPDRLGARKPLGSMTPVHVITTCRSPSYRVMATDECFSLFSIGKVWSGTKSRHAKWSRKMRRSSRFMGAVFAALKRSMLMKCGRQGLPTIPSDKNLLDNEGEFRSREYSQSERDTVHSLSANHQFHRPL